MRLLCLIILSLFVISQAVAQPRIDSMFVDENLGRLNIHGRFGVSTGKVTCDGTELPILAWNDSSIISILPDSGQGSVGPVVVTDNEARTSNRRLISFWRVAVVHTYQRWLVQPYVEYNNFAADVFIRFDIESVLLRGGSSQYISFESTVQSKRGGVSGSNVHYTQVKDAVPTDVHQTTVILNPRSHYLELPEYNWDWQFPTRIRLDSALQPISGTGYVNGPDPAVSTTWKAGGSSFLPSRTELRLLNPPVPTTPLNGSIVSPTRPVVLVWRDTMHVDSCIVELGTDSEFRAPVLVYSMPSNATSLMLSDLDTTKQYFWRIYGKTLEGRSPFSTVSMFSFPGSLYASNDRSTAPSFQVRLDWSTHLLSISALGGDEIKSVSVFDDAGRMMGGRSVNDPSMEVIDLSHLASGTYLVCINGVYTSKVRL